MDILKFANEALLNCIENKVSFQNSIKELIKVNKDLLNKRAELSAILGCELRHHIFLETIVNSLNLEEESLNNKLAIYLCLANIYFLKKYTVPECRTYLSYILNKNDMDKIEPLLVFTGSPIDLIPANIERQSDLFTSIRFNIPLWLLKMWQKHYGRGVSFKLLKRLNKPSEQYCRINTNLTNKSELLVTKKDLFGDTDNLHLVKYISRLPIKRIDAINEFKIFPIKYALKNIFDNLNIDSYRRILLYSANDQGAIFEMFMHSFNREVNICVPDINLFPNVIHQIRANELYRPINFFAPTELGFLHAHISSLQDLVICYPSSSRFENAKKQPEYLINFDRFTLTDIINNEVNALSDMAKACSEDGTLVYIVDTLNRKESKGIISSFLSSHPEFTLINEKQYLPFDEYDTMMFYAVFKRSGGEK